MVELGLGALLEGMFEGGSEVVVGTVYQSTSTLMHKVKEGGYTLSNKNRVV